MKQKITLIAEEGKIITDGVHFGRIVHLAPDMDASDHYEISEEEYHAIMEKREEERNA